MSGKTDVVKGRIKEAAGVLTGNGRLRAEGMADQAVGKTKQAVRKTIGTGVTRSGKTDVAKGRIKEAAGVLTGNDRLRAEGMADQAVGKTKQAVRKTVESVKKAVRKAVR
jgi:uncharacterized protein YjbJ (UPF0337 family)